MKRPIMATKHVEDETLPGAPDRLCGNCAHYRAARVGTLVRGAGECGNGISGRIKTTPVHGCGRGFYPALDRWPLGAGPGGVFREVNQ